MAYLMGRGHELGVLCIPSLSIPHSLVGRNYYATQKGDPGRRAVGATDQGTGWH